MIKEDIELYRRFTLLLSRQKGLGSRKFKKLLYKFDNIANLYSCYINGEIKPLIPDFDLDDPVFDLLIKSDVEYVCLWEDNFPALLKEIADPPTILYYKGKINSNVFDPAVTIVGTRQITQYGKRVISRLVEFLVENNVTIISGMAFGVDAYAHEMALKYGGKTIAVLPGTVNKPIPSSNKYIYDSILDNHGIVLAEFAPDIDISPGMFAFRNRILAGLSKVTIVIEAGDKSGSLITADLAFNYDREVFAVPGDIFLDQTKGTHKLIAENKARILDNFDLVLDEIGLHKRRVDIARLDLSQEEKKVIEKLKIKGYSVDELSVELAIEIGSMIYLCSVLELKGLVQKVVGGNYILV